MLTKITIRNFKLFDEVELELGERVVMIGPNNAGKTSALQALALWDVGVKRWTEKRGTGDVPQKRPGVTVNRRDLITIPVPAANLLWHNLRTQETFKKEGKNKVEKVFIEIVVEGVDQGKSWNVGLEFYYANEESFYCRPLILKNGKRMEVPAPARDLKLAYLPPMSGITSAETKLDEGAVNVRLGEGRTAEVLRNLCFQVSQDRDNKKWEQLVNRIDDLFGITLEAPKYVPERGEIVLSYRTKSKIRLDISASGRGQQQTLLLLAHMIANTGSVLLLDEPDAHLEILRQRQIYQVLTDVAAETGSQILAASHSEVLLNEAADRDVVVAFVGKPHRIDDRGSQVLKALKEIGFEHYYQAEEIGWVLYLEGSTDLAILRSLARVLRHPAAELLERPFVHYVGNQPMKARDHFYGLREAKEDIVGLTIMDRSDSKPDADPNLPLLQWKKREIENYIADREALLRYAEDLGREQLGELFGRPWRQTMESTIDEIENALGKLRQSPWSADIKVTDQFLDPLFESFYEKLDLPNLMRKTDYHTLAPLVDPKKIDAEVAQKLDAIVEVASRATPRNDHP